MAVGIMHAIGVNRCPNSWQIALTRLERDSQLLHQLLHPCSIFVPGARVFPKTNVRKIYPSHGSHFSLVSFAKSSVNLVKKRKKEKEKCT